MVSKHFFKTLIIFIVIIVFAMAGIFLVSYFDVDKDSFTEAENVQIVENTGSVAN